MKLTKKELINAVQSAATETITKKEAEDRLENVFLAVSNELQNGNDVPVQGFGKFVLHESAEREGRNPSTGEAMTIPSQTLVKFRCADALKKSVN